MEIFNQEFIQEIIRLTWRNPAFMAIAIALVWLIPQLFIRSIMAKKYEERKVEIQKNKIQKLYPTNTPKSLSSFEAFLQVAITLSPLL